MCKISNNEYIDCLESALIDLLDGVTEKEIQTLTGLSSERCLEIRQIYLDAWKNYKRKHNII